ncbi:hypothetical protein POL88_21160 [Priestia megaterium]|uniref:hypothetical protein n=1 Tax=Priestia megaterium TaxID=1404 RepID=UPI00234E8434|nr:hypothetical protein [Priestia megaterium]MDC7771450.1 hypothetical protein [Priestia megaterium]
MKKFDDLPKNVKKTIRYIYQDASFEQLILLERHLKLAIEKRYESHLGNKINT